MRTTRTARPVLPNLPVDNTVLSTDLIEFYSNADMARRQTTVQNLLAGIGGGIEFRGTFDISSPATAEYPKGVAATAVNAVQTGDGSGAGPTIQTGDFWIVINGGGNVGPSPFAVLDGYRLVALVDNAANVDANRSIIPNAPLPSQDAILTEVGVSKKISQMSFGTSAEMLNATLPYISGGSNWRNNLRQEIFPLYGLSSVNNVLTVDVNAPVIVGYRYQSVVAAQTYALTQVPSTTNRRCIVAGGTNNESFTMLPWIAVRGGGACSVFTGAIDSLTPLTADPEEIMMADLVAENIVLTGMNYMGILDCSLTAGAVTGGQILSRGCEFQGGDRSALVNSLHQSAFPFAGNFGSGSTIQGGTIANATVIDGAFCVNSIIAPGVSIITGSFASSDIFTTNITGNIVMSGGMLSNYSTVVAGQTLDLTNVNIIQSLTYDGTLNTRGCMGAYPTPGIGARNDTGDLYKNTTASLASLDVNSAINEVAGMGGTETAITRAALDALMTGSLVTIGARYRVTDRFDLRVQGLTTDTVSGAGWMTIPALTTPTNANDEVIYIQYNVSADTFGNYRDANGNHLGNLNETNFSLPFASLVGLLIQVEFGNQAIDNNELSTNTNIVTTVAGGSVSHNKFRGQVAVTIGAATSVIENTIEIGSVLNALDGSATGCYVGSGGSSLSVGAGGSASASTAINGGFIITAGGISAQDFVNGGTIQSNNGQTSGCESSAGSTISAVDKTISNTKAMGGCTITKTSGNGVINNCEMKGTGTFNHLSDNNSEYVYLEGVNSITVAQLAQLNDAKIRNSTISLSDSSSISQGTLIDNCDITGTDDGIIQGGVFRYHNGITIGLSTVLVGLEIEDVNLTGMINFTGQTFVNERLCPGFSSLQVTIDLDTFPGYVGTSLDFASIRHYGDIIFTSANPALSIGPFSNYNDNHPVRDKPVSGLTLTVLDGVGAGDPRCEGGVNRVLNGTNGDNATYEFFSERGEVFEINANGY